MALFSIGSAARSSPRVLTGLSWLSESGFLEGPVVLTNTHSVGLARDAVIAWQNRRGPGAQPWGLPVVAETWDGWLNDINGFHVKEAHVFRALHEARGRAQGTAKSSFTRRGSQTAISPSPRWAQTW
jgi:L-aminopeptidase/D-esterase-like protein